MTCRSFLLAGSRRKRRVLPMWECCQLPSSISNERCCMMKLEDRIIRFAARCVRVCAVLPVKAVGSASFADQLFRSSTGIAANYAEACEAESAKDFVHKLKIAMKELSETRTWLRLIGEAGYVENGRLVELIGESRELSRIFSASVTTTKKKIGG